MIEHLKSDDIIRKCGGRFKLASLIQRRWHQIAIEGARPLVERDGRSDLELAIEEIAPDKIAINFSEGDITKPDKALA